MPSNKTLVSKFGLIRRTQPLLLYAGGGDKPKQVPAASASSGRSFGLNVVVSAACPWPAAASGGGSKNAGGASALTLAASTNDVPVVKLLAAGGAELNAADTQPRPAECLQAHTFTQLRNDQAQQFFETTSKL